MTKTGRNDLCPCGSGLKHKKCCLIKSDSAKQKRESSSTKTSSPFSDLTDLETFNPKIFKGDSQVSQDVCNFILALGCIYNDNRDILLAEHYLTYLRPSFPVKETPEWGEHNGILVHLMRLQLSLLHELLELIERNSKIIKNSFFKSIIGDRLDNIGKIAWEILLDASNGKTTNHKTNKTLLKIRNTIAFHYDPKVFFKGYESWFLKGNKKPYISKGSKLNQERYYFAEACAQGYLDSICSDINVKPKDLRELVNFISPAISQIVKHFILVRQQAIKKEKTRGESL